MVHALSGRNKMLNNPCEIAFPSVLQKGFQIYSVYQLFQNLGARTECVAVGFYRSVQRILEGGISQLQCSLFCQNLLREREACNKVFSCVSDRS